jgi:non-lysosomal glucosylceramidase
MEPPIRKCNCSGNCAPQQPGLISRRDFLERLSAGGAAALLVGPAWGAFELPASEWERWRRELLGASAPRRYLSATHTDARMHLGGIGTGNFEIGVDGRLTNWQLFNTLRDGEVPLHFLVKAGTTAKLLQTTGGPDWPRIKEIEMIGEYPLATLRFQDPQLPVELELTAFSPFVPLDSRFSSRPLAAFIFRIHNPAKNDQTVSLAALMQNPVGYDAQVENRTQTNPSFGYNLNEAFQEGTAAGLLMRAVPGSEPALDRPVAVYTFTNLVALVRAFVDRPANLTVEIVNEQQAAFEKARASTATVIWIEQPSARISEAFLRAARGAVEEGATLLLSGSSLPLLQIYAGQTDGEPIAETPARPDIVFEDFEHGYENWKVEGEAFGQEPARGTLPNQQEVTGFLGRGLVNTYFHGDGTTGRLISKPFEITRHLIRFLIGGGSSTQTQIRLIVDGKVVRAASGRDNERLEPAIWEVTEFQGRSAHIEIVDEATGGWGHVNIDQIEFSDGQEVMALLEEMLPVRFSDVRPANAEAENLGHIEFADVVLKPGAVESALANGIRLFTRPLGKGKVVIAAGAVLEPAQAAIINARQRAYATVCGLAGATYASIQGQHPKAPGFGTLALVTLGQKPSVQPDISDLHQAWDAFAGEGRFGRTEDSRPRQPTPPGETVYGGVSSTVSVPAGATRELPFLLAWHYPNKYAKDGHTWIGCHYATDWADAGAVIKESAHDFTPLQERTELFRKTFYDSTLPYWLLDCLTANAAIIRHIGVVFRIANGDVYGWEGSNGCCDPTCTHVWGYEQTLARLFPDLERDMRRIDFKHQQRPDGGINNRTEVPSPPHPTGEQPFADGHASCILKAYREALNSPNEAFFKEYWPQAKRAVEYLIERDGKGAGGQPSGILQDDQWNTYDEALHGITTFISGYYLAALRAGEAWSRRVGDAAAAERFHVIFEKGRNKLVERCWNGEYFEQNLPDYMSRSGEVGPGCMADQLIAQWWAHQLGLGYILPKEMVVAALWSVFKNNFKSDLTEWHHAPRAFAGTKDKGLIICTWPKGGRPANVMLYSDEVWTGIEYQVAAHMIYEGLVEEGLTIVKAARDRYDGIPRAPIPRNPWNEIECGGHYARAMSSWSLLLALSGWEYDGPRKTLRFTPRFKPEDFRSFFAGPEGWGSLRQHKQDHTQTIEIAVAEGVLHVAEINVVPLVTRAEVRLEHGGKKVQASSASSDGILRIACAKPVAVRKGETLVIRMSAKS